MNSSKSSSARDPKLGPASHQPPTTMSVADLAKAWLGGLLLALVLAAAPARDATADDAFARTIKQLGTACASGPALACVERGFALADADDDAQVDSTEIHALKNRLRDWTASNASALPAADLKALQLGFVLTDTIGVERGMLLYDTDGDGTLSFAEATADLHLDNRPLPELVRERALINWPSLRRRFGASALLFDYLDLQ